MSESSLIGIEIGGTKLQAVVGDAEGNIAKSVKVAARATGGAAAILEQLQGTVQELLTEFDQNIVAMGIGFGGPVDSARGAVIKSNHVVGWEDVSLVDWAAEHFQLPCAVGNDTDVAAMAEARVGGGRHDRCVFYTNIGSGIGGGLVVDGNLYARPSGAMEVGHSRVYSKFDQRYGILEEFCSGWSLDRRARVAAEGDQKSLLWKIANDSLANINASTLFDAWQQGDAAATQVVECFLDCYAVAMSNMVALLNPDVVIIGGGVAKRGETLLRAIRDRVGQLVYEPFADAYRIELTSLQEHAVPVGALLLAAKYRSKLAREP